MNAFNPFCKTCFAFIDALSITYKTNNNAPIGLTVHTRNQVFGFTIWEALYPFLFSHETLKFFLRPCTLGFIEYSYVLSGNICFVLVALEIARNRDDFSLLYLGTFKVEVAIMMYHLDESLYLTFGFGLCACFSTFT